MERRVLRLARIGPPSSEGPQAGLTLFELAITMALLGVFLGAVYQSVTLGLRTAAAANTREGVRQQVAYAMDLLTREAGLADAVDEASDQTFQFDCDVDADGTVDQDIRYEVVSGTLRRTQGGATQTLVHSVFSLDFDYLNSSGADMATPVTGSTNLNGIRVVQVVLTGGPSDEQISLASSAFLRNNN